MLLINRGIGERFVIGENVLIQLIGFRGKKQLCIGIAAPLDIEIQREEMYLKKYGREHPMTIFLRQNKKSKLIVPIDIQEELNEKN